MKLGLFSLPAELATYRQLSTLPNPVALRRLNLTAIANSVSLMSKQPSVWLTMQANRASLSAVFP